MSSLEVIIYVFILKFIYVFLKKAPVMKCIKQTKCINYILNMSFITEKV